MDAVDSERLFGDLVEGAARAVDVDECDALLGGDRGDGLVVECDACVVFLAGRQAGVAVVLEGDGGEQHQPRLSLSVVPLLTRVFDEFLEVILELRDAFTTTEGLDEPEECEDHVGLAVREVLVTAAEAGRALLDRQLVGREPEVAKRELQAGEPPLESRLEPAVVLHALGQRIADEADVVTHFEGESSVLRRGVGRLWAARIEGGREGDGEGNERARQHDLDFLEMRL